MQEEREREECAECVRATSREVKEVGGERVGRLFETSLREDQRSISYMDRRPKAVSSFITKHARDIYKRMHKCNIYEYAQNTCVLCVCVYECVQFNVGVRDAQLSLDARNARIAYRVVIHKSHFGYGHVQLWIHCSSRWTFGMFPFL